MLKLINLKIRKYLSDKLDTRWESKTLLDNVLYLKRSKDIYYNKFYLLLEKIFENDFLEYKNVVLNHLIVIETKESALISYIDKRSYKDFEKNFVNFISKLEKEVNFKISLKNLDNKQNREVGALFGLATGDALGTTLEFRSATSEGELHTEIIGGGEFKLKAGEWTDDTSMALCIAESIIKDGFDLESQMKLYAEWMRHGYLSSTGRCFDIGITTSNAIKKYINKGDIKAGSKESHHSGNGSIMRLSPVPIYAKDISEAIKLSGESSLTTHGSDECFESCKLLGAIIKICIDSDGLSKNELFAKLKLLERSHLELKEEKVIELLNQTNWLNLDYEELPNSGYVIDTMITALWCFYHTSSFEDALIKAVNLGGDADTIGAVCGQIAGAYYGYNNIPDRWKSKIKQANFIIEKAIMLPKRIEFNANFA